MDQSDTQKDDSRTLEAALRRLLVFCTVGLLCSAAVQLFTLHQSGDARGSFAVLPLMACFYPLSLFGPLWAFRFGWLPGFFGMVGVVVVSAAGFFVLGGH
jgi:hypothetical protein